MGEYSLQHWDSDVRVPHSHGSQFTSVPVPRLSDSDVKTLLPLSVNALADLPQVRSCRRPLESGHGNQRLSNLVQEVQCPATQSVGVEVPLNGLWGTFRDCLCIHLR